MSSRELWIKIGGRLEASFGATIGQAQQKVSEFDRALQENADKRQALNDIGTTFGKVGLAAGAASLLAVKSFADFDAAMSAVKATGEDAADSFDELRQAALDAGKDTAFSATESAAAIENLAKAGISAADILSGGLDGALSLAAAGGLGVAEAAEIAAVAMTQFGLAGEDLPHVADLLSAAAGKANGEVSDMGQALGQAGLVAGQMGLSIEETTGTLAAFAQAGLLGSDAGTSFKSMLQRLANPSKESAELMKQFGIEAYNASGELVSMTELAGQLETAFAGQTQATRDAAMAQIFGSDAIRAANVLYSEGAAGIADWTAQVDDAGYAAETAATRMDNLKGDIELLKGSLETALIGTGSGANSPLRSTTQDLTRLVDTYSDLPPILQESTFRFLAFNAAIGGVGFLSTRAVTGFADMANSINMLRAEGEKLSRTQLFMRGGSLVAGTALASIQPAAQEASASLGILNATAAGALVGTAILPGWGTAIGGAAGATWGLVEAFAAAETAGEQAAEAAKSTWGELVTTLSGLNAEITEATRSMAGQKLQDSGLSKMAADLGIELRTLIDVSLGVPGAFDEMNAAFAASGDGDWTSYQELQLTLRELTGQFQEGQEQARELGFAAIDTAEQLSSIPPEVIVELENRNWDLTMEEIQALQAQYDLTPDEVNTLAFLRDEAARQSTTDLLAYLTTLDGTTAVPDAYVADGATPLIQQIQARLAGLDGDSATVTVYGKLAGALAGPGASQALKNLGLAEADGGVLSFYRNGGVRENHVAQMAPAGSWRIWGEPETGGESYIPHAPSKRNRSLEIWEQTGRILGAQRFAAGGLTTGVPVPQATATALVASLGQREMQEFARIVAGAVISASTNVTGVALAQQQRDARGSRSTPSAVRGR